MTSSPACRTCAPCADCRQAAPSLPRACALRSTPVGAGRTSSGRAAPPRSVYLSGGFSTEIKHQCLPPIGVQALFCLYVLLLSANPVSRPACFRFLRGLSPAGPRLAPFHAFDEAAPCGATGLIPASQPRFATSKLSLLAGSVPCGTPSDPVSLLR